MARIAVTSSADMDTANIIAYLAAKAGEKTTAYYIAAFEALYDRLAHYPESGAARPALGGKVRISIIPPYIVIYEYADAKDTVFVLVSCMAAARLQASCY